MIRAASGETVSLISPNVISNRHRKETLVSGEHRIRRPERDTPRTMKGTIVLIVLFTMLGISITLVLQHHDVWTPNQLLTVP
jgi:hypothetical protein